MIRHVIPTLLLVLLATLSCAQTKEKPPLAVYDVGSCDAVGDATMCRALVHVTRKDGKVQQLVLTCVATPEVSLMHGQKSCFWPLPRKFDLVLIQKPPNCIAHRLTDTANSTPSGKDAEILGCLAMFGSNYIVSTY
jgi:hypothetical protein